VKGDEFFNNIVDVFSNRLLIQPGRGTGKRPDEQDSKGWIIDVWRMTETAANLDEYHSFAAAALRERTPA
jgi:hypothetical protein